MYKASGENAFFSFQLLTIFVSAKLAAYVKFYQSNKDFIESLGEYSLKGFT